MRSITKSQNSQEQSTKIRSYYLLGIYVRSLVSFIQSYGIVSYSSQDLFRLSIIILILNDKLLELDKEIPSCIEREFRETYNMNKLIFI